MTTYKKAGVDVAAGDRASRLAYQHAASTFAGRQGMIGQPVLEEDGFAGFLDMGDYYLVQSDDSTGTKIDLAFELNRFHTLGFDLLAMVADDAVCVGAEVISVSNCLDVPAIQPDVIDALMGGLAEACRQQRIVVPAGEIAEVPGAVTRGVWSATSVGIVEKEKVLRPATITPGDVIIALRSAGARSNGFSLVRRILHDAFGSEWARQPWKHGLSWGEAFLTPCHIYHAAMLTLLGRFRQPRAVPVKGVAHITGGGIPSKLRRVLRKSGCGATLTDLWPPHEMLRDLIDLGSVAEDEAYRTWNMGNGMLIVLAEDQAGAALEALQQQGCEAQIAGRVTAESSISIQLPSGEGLEFDSGG